ncbi:MAG: M15 family metallopeptidase [Clostridiales bacterium]|nr:M15 family metallopeptidase [Clostridiales bacterium]
MNRRKTVVTAVIGIVAVAVLALLVLRFHAEQQKVLAQIDDEQAQQMADLTAVQTQQPDSAEPGQNDEPTPESEPEPAPGPYADRPDIDITQWQYRLVNTEHLLDGSYAPEMTTLEGGHMFDARAADALKDFIAGARAEGLSVYMVSTYRSYETQKYLFDRKLSEKLAGGLGQDAAYAAAARIVAIPGTSEHQTGLAADITDQHYAYMNESLEDTALFQWMQAHCAEYGFIVRFPKEKQDVTGIMYEPWHFRYVGQEAAQYIMDNGLCLEEFVALYDEPGQNTAQAEPGV